MKANGKKKSILFAILVLLLAIVLAILFSISFFCLCVLVFAPKAEYRDLEMHEEWNKER